uniref:Uncharacterized protein n=1 Tax=Myoviridae sp. ctPkm1 TaxID=2825099 RepID=A0A8S5TYB0_9CAUD|nr:MAG TPA: hypothetical protein [Myoviridae sp. ctPkm1]
MRRPPFVVPRFFRLRTKTDDVLKTSQKRPFGASDVRVR